MTGDNKKLLSELSRTSYGRALQEYLDEHFNELKDVSNAKSWDDTLARQQAVRILKNLFYFMEEKKTSDKQKTTFV